MPKRPKVFPPEKGTIEEYRFDALNTLKGHLLAPPEIPASWDRRLVLYRGDGVPAATAVSILLEEGGYFDDE